MEAARRRRLQRSSIQSLFALTWLVLSSSECTIGRRMESGVALRLPPQSLSETSRLPFGGVNSTVRLLLGRRLRNAKKHSGWILVKEIRKANGARIVATRAGAVEQVVEGTESHRVGVGSIQMEPRPIDTYDQQCLVHRTRSAISVTANAASAPMVTASQRCQQGTRKK